MLPTLYPQHIILVLIFLFLFLLLLFPTFSGRVIIENFVKKKILLAIKQSLKILTQDKLKVGDTKN